MDIEPPRQARSTTPPPQHRSHSARISSPLRSNHLSSPHHLHPNKGHSPLRPRSPLPSTPPRSPPHSHSPLPSRSITTPPHQPNSPSEETEEHLEDGCSISSPSGRRRKIGGGGETKHSLVARLKKTLNERLHSVKPVLLAWLQKYLGDQRLSDILSPSSPSRFFYFIYFNFTKLDLTYVRLRKQTTVSHRPFRIWRQDPSERCGLSNHPKRSNFHQAFARFIWSYPYRLSWYVERRGRVVY